VGGWRRQNEERWRWQLHAHNGNALLFFQPIIVIVVVVIYFLDFQWFAKNMKVFFCTYCTVIRHVVLPLPSILS
jgi:hypothetical protein